MTNNEFNLDYKNLTCQILSPELPCGSAWLTNCFIELNLAVTNKWDLIIKDEWIRIKPFHYRYNDKKSWQQVLPSLEYNKEYSLHPNHAISVQHIWPFMATENTKTIFFIRHPFDALFSFWRRNTYNSNHFKGEFEMMMDQKYHHYNFTVKDYLLIYYTLLKWYQNNNDCLIIKFEDYKSNAFTTLSHVLNYLSINKTEKEIINAVNQSDVSKVLTIESALQTCGKLSFKNHFKGQAFEFRETYSQTMLNSLNEDFEQLCKWFDYPYPVTNTRIKNQPHLSTEQLSSIASTICLHKPDFKEQIIEILTPLKQQIKWKNT